jgi:Spy/CpxP family protein refolding chaperone
MMMKTVAAALLLGTSLSAAPALAQSSSAGNASIDMPREPLTAQDLEALRTELRATRKQLMAQNLILTPDESTRFWPIYDRYQAELSKIKDDQYQLIAEYANTYGKYDSDGATDFITRWLDLDVRTTALRAHYVPIVKEVLPGVKATTFFQIDRRVSMMIDQRIASMLPLLEFQSQVAQ